MMNVNDLLMIFFSLLCCGGLRYYYYFLLFLSNVISQSSSVCSVERKICFTTTHQHCATACIIQRVQRGLLQDSIYPGRILWKLMLRRLLSLSASHKGKREWMYIIVTSTYIPSISHGMVQPRGFWDIGHHCPLHYETMRVKQNYIVCPTIVVVLFAKFSSGQDSISSIIKYQYSVIMF